MNILLLFFITFSTWNDSSLTNNYLQSYAGIAKAEMKRTGIPASIKLAQGMLESDYGRSTIANKANNHFGIKCGSNWEGKGFYRKDDDYSRDGELMKSCFRVFDSAEDSFIAHSEFIRDPKKEYRYGSLFQLSKNDYKSWAHGLKKAGYATDREYPNKLIYIIEKYGLSQYDEEVMNELGEEVGRTYADNIPPKAERIKEAQSAKSKATATSSDLKRIDIKLNNSVRYVMAREGETAEMLAHRVGLPVDNILVYNDHLTYPAEELHPKIPVYIEHKNRDYKGPLSRHIVKPTETLEIIAQLYGIRVATLRTLNRISKNGTPLVGEKISLNKKVKTADRPKCKRKEKKQYIF